MTTSLAQGKAVIVLWEYAPKLLAASLFTFARSHGPSEDAPTAWTARPIAEEALQHQGGTHALAIPPLRTSALRIPHKEGLTMRSKSRKTSVCPSRSHFRGF